MPKDLKSLASKKPKKKSSKVQILKKLNPMGFDDVNRMNVKLIRGK